MRIALGAMLVVLVAMAMGCEGDVSSGPDTAQLDGAAPPPPAPTPPGDPGDAEEAENAEMADAEAAPETDGAPDAASAPELGQPDTQPASDQPAAAPGGTTEVASATSGAKGRDYGGPGFVTTPIQAYFRADARINLLSMANALKIYKAGHNDKGPKTHEEFMEVIVKENGIDLPVLPVGEEYVYDPEKEQLLVRQPAPMQ